MALIRVQEEYCGWVSAGQKVCPFIYGVVFGEEERSTWKKRVRDYSGVWGSVAPEEEGRVFELSHCQSMCPWMPLWVLFISTDAPLSCVPSPPEFPS